MGLKEEVEKVCNWACDKVEDCCECKYVVKGKLFNFCPFDNVIRAIEDKEAGK